MRRRRRRRRRIFSGWWKQTPRQRNVLTIDGVIQRSTIVEETPEETSPSSSSSSSLITILNTTNVFPELESYGRIRYDLYSTKAQELCSRNVNVCKELRHGALSERCWKSLSEHSERKIRSSPIVASST